MKVEHFKKAHIVYNIKKWRRSLMARTGVFQAPDGGSILPGAENFLK